VVLVSCEQIEPGGSPTPAIPNLSPTATTIPLAPNASTAARIRARGFLLVGVRYDDEPFGVVDEQGDLIGFDVDLAHEFAFRWLGDAEAVRFVQVTNTSAGERIATEHADLIIGALPPAHNLAPDMDFSTAYYYDGLALLLHTTPQAAADDGSTTEPLIINGPGDLDEIPVAVVEETDIEAPLYRAAGRAVPQIIFYPDYFSAVAGLENGVVEAVAGPRRTLARLVAGVAGTSGDLAFTPRFTRDPYAIGLPKSDGALRDLVNVTLMNILNDGTYAQLFEQWFSTETYPELEVWPGTSRLRFDSLSDTFAPVPSTIQDIEARGYLIVGLLNGQLPFADFDANGVARGFEAELARALAGRWLGDLTAIQFVQHTEESGIAALQAGQIDLLAARLPHTLRRDDEIDFSQTIYQGGIGLLVSAESGIKSLAELNGAAVVVPREGTMADVVQRAATRAGISVSVQTVNDANAALAGVAEGRYRAYVDWRSNLLNLAYTHQGFLVLDQRLTRRPIALGLRQNDADFRDLVDFTLQALAAEGRFAALYDDWFGTDPPFAVEIWPGAPYRPLQLTPLSSAAPAETP
jgi:ABC-type amino acid transport substrate-binding protein